MGYKARVSASGEDVFCFHHGALIAKLVLCDRERWRCLPPEQWHEALARRITDRLREGMSMDQRLAIVRAEHERWHEEREALADQSYAKTIPF